MCVWCCSEGRVGQEQKGRSQPQSQDRVVGLTLRGRSQGWCDVSEASQSACPLGSNGAQKTIARAAGRSLHREEGGGKSRHAPSK